MEAKVRKNISIIAATCAVFVITGTLAQAESPGNSGAAKDMGGVLSDSPGIGGAAPSVSGNNNPNPATSGWGNTGSAALSPGGQVSRGRGPDATQVLLKVDGQGDVSELQDLAS